MISTCNDILCPVTLHVPYLNSACDFLWEYTAHPTNGTRTDNMWATASTFTVELKRGEGIKQTNFSKSIGNKYPPTYQIAAKPTYRAVEKRMTLRTEFPVTVSEENRP
jgi:hypothetical protein